MKDKLKRLGDKIKDRITANPVIGSIALAMALGMAGSILFCLSTAGSGGNIFEAILWILLLGALLGIFIFYPVILSFINLIKLFVRSKTEAERRTEKKFEIITLLVGSVDTLLLLSISSIRMSAEWSEQLVNGEIHQPLFTGAAPTVLVLCLAGVIGYLVLSHVSLKKLPPLVTVLSISSMYLGMLECILWMVQTMSGTYWLLSLFPANCIVIGIKTIRYIIGEWNQIEEPSDTQREAGYPGKPFLHLVNRVLAKAELWSVAALLLSLPLLGILLGILVLFGQQPDAMIKAWTETAQWRLSKQTAPPNVMYDEHYLCTVAAGGHEKLVKPLRMGERHGHRVVVNRQLCIANAFEQILEEKTPKFHRRVRHFYDTYGFPVARLIRTKAAADVVYVLMKPLEWIFLCVIYLCDVKPENRIAVQYLPCTKMRV